MNRNTAQPRSSSRRIRNEEDHLKVQKHPY